MAKYKKRNDGRYATTITVTVDGERRKKYIYGKTIREVDDKIAELRAADKRGAITEPNDITVSEWARTWLDTYKRGKVSDNTFHGYENAVEVHIIPRIGAYRLNQLRPNHLQGVLNELITAGEIPTARKVKIVLTNIIKTAIKERYIIDNIADCLELPAYKSKEKRTLTEDEVELIKRTELTTRQRAFVDLLYYTGLRRGEALALTSSDIDFDKSTIRVNKTIVFGKNQSTIKDSPKTSAGERTLPMPEALKESLQEIVEEGEPLFRKQGGGYLTKTAMRRMWESIIQKLEKESGNRMSNDLTPHLFRHNYATILYKAGIDVKTAQYLLGHSTIQVTLAIYTHLSQVDNSKLTEKLNSIFN